MSIFNDIRDRAIITLRALLAIKLNGSDVERKIFSRVFYENVYSSPRIITGLISSECYHKVRTKKKYRPVYEHFTRPQIVGYKLYDLIDNMTEEEFINIFTICCHTIYVTSTENNSLKDIAEDIKYNESYQNKQIELLKYDANSRQHWCNRDVKLVSNDLSNVIGEELMTLMSH